MARRMKTRLLPGFTAALGLAAAGAGGAQAKTLRVVMDNLEFTPANITASVGDTIDWVNRDFLDHTATASDGKWELVLPAGTSKEFQVKDAGTLEYYCRYHPNMKGVITVGR